LFLPEVLVTQEEIIPHFGIKKKGKAITGIGPEGP
jgi:hypothetical protein